MKFGPKEIKELNEYLRTGRNRKREFLGGGITFASDLTKPESKKEIVEIDAINSFVNRNPRADGGRMGYALGSTDDPVVPQNNLIGSTDDSLVSQNNLMDMSLEESTTGPGGFPMTASLTALPKLYDTVPKATKLIESGAATAAKAKKIVTDFFKQRQPYTGATKIGESTIKDFTPEKNFLSVLKSYMDKYTGGSLTGAAKNLGITRNTLKGIKERINRQETGKRTSDLSTLFTKPAKIEEPLDGLQYAQMTTLMKNDPNKFKILKGGDNKFLDQESLGHYLGVKFLRDDRGTRTGIGKFQYDQFGRALRKLKVKTNQLGEFNVDDAINKLLAKNKTKLVKGQRLSDIGKDRYTIEKKFDPELLNVRAQLTDRVSKRSKGLDVYLPNAVDDVGHPFSLSKHLKKYKNLFKDSNMNSINTLVYQDHTLNTQLHKITGFEGRYEKMFDILKKLQNKKITPKIQEQLLDVKNQMNKNYNDYIEFLSNPQKIKDILTKNKLNFADDFVKYLSSQADRVQKIDINVPKIGDTFKSKDIFVDMSTVNPKYIMGYVNQINSKAKKFKDLSMSEQAIFKQNALKQNADIVAEYYKKAKFPIDDVEAVKETVKMDFAKGGPVNIDLTMPKFATGGRIGFESGTIPGGYTDDAYAYLREIDDEIFNAYKKYKAGGGHLKYGPYAYNAKRAMFGAFGIGVPKAYQRKAEGGIIGDKSGPPPERGPNPQGLQGLLKRVKNI